MQCDRDKWIHWYESNKSDAYGMAILNYAERWAELMEARIAAGESLSMVAKETSHVADTEGITGFMYGAAVHTLADCWIHGEELRQWHNLSTQIGDEGDEANETGGVLNPAILVLGGGE